jgi:hypothetical protein
MIQTAISPSRIAYAPSSAFAPPVVFVVPVTPCDEVAIVEAMPAKPPARCRADTAAASAAGNCGGGGGGGGNCGCAVLPPPKRLPIAPITEPIVSPVRLSASVSNSVLAKNLTIFVQKPLVVVVRPYRHASSQKQADN